MNYSAFSYVLMFVPAVMLVYALFPQKYRWIVLLAADYIFFISWSKWLVVYLLVSTLVTYLFGRKLESMRKPPKDVDRKVFKKKKNRIKVIGVLIQLGTLIVLKYTNFIGQTLLGDSFTTIHILVPIGISYYTLQSISFMSDVSNKKVHCDSFWKVALYLSFFPTIVEGPISRYGEVADDLYAGRQLSADNIIAGYRRILWGLFQKAVIADHLVHVVDSIFNSYQQDGFLCLLGAVLCTIQLYMDFCGSIDIGIGTAKIFGVTLPENFRQPFFAKNAGDFWHRWHITLGTFFRDYIFYPVSLSKPVQKLTKKVGSKSRLLQRYLGPAIALLMVWLANGFWHGPYWTYVGYGIYYFVLMLIEMLWEKPFEEWWRRRGRDGKPLRIFRFCKLLVIVFIGEMFFRAKTFADGWTMFTSIFTNFHPVQSWGTIGFLGMDAWDWLVCILSFCVVIVVSVLREKGISIWAWLEKKPAYIRWSAVYLLIFAIRIFGAYGPGYDKVAMMYAGF